MKLTLAACASLALIGSGCMGFGSVGKTTKSLAKELKNQTIIVKANTPWGPQTLIALNTNTSIVMSPDGTMRINATESGGLLITPTTTTTTTLQTQPVPASK